MRFASAVIAAGFMVALLMVSCAVGPDYRRPDAQTPQDYKEQGVFKPSHPNDAAVRGEWWSIYNDPILDGLEQQVVVSNQTLKASEAAYRQALAIVDAARAGYYPTVGVSGGAQRSGHGGGQNGPGTQTVNQYNLTASASWTLDVWGRIRRTVESDVATAQASAGDLASACLSAQSTLAVDYFQIRVDDELSRVLQATSESYSRSLEITDNQYKSGVASRADVAQAKAQLEGVQSEAIAVGIQRAQMEHAIAVLMGKLPETFSVPAIKTLPTPPQIPLDVPSTLLERRPDIAANERRMAAANAQIGVAIAAYYPDVTLSASFGYASSLLSTLLNTANSLWSFGGQVADTVFDGGLRSAQVAQARAGYDETVANYRQTVLTAFQQIEDQLVALRLLNQQMVVADQAVVDAAQAESLILNQYKAGFVAYTSVITAQNITLSDRQSALTIRSNLLSATVNLIVDLGGGWHETADGQILPAPGAKAPSNQSTGSTP